MIFLQDPLTAQPHEPEIATLLRISDVHNVALATNLASAEGRHEALAPSPRPGPRSIRPIRRYGALAGPARSSAGREGTSRRLAVR